jgi:hypothetical protein
MTRGFYPAVRLSSSLLQLVQVRNSCSDEQGVGCGVWGVVSEL